MPISEITQQKKQAAETSVQAAGLEATALSLGDILMGSVRDARAERGVSKLAEDRGTAMGQLASEPADIREFGTQEGFRMDPLDVDAFTGQARAQNLRTLGTVAQKGKEQEGTLQEVIQAGANQMYGMASMKEAEAKRDREEADALMEELIYEADRADRGFDEWLAREKLGDSRKGSEKDTRQGYTSDGNKDYDSFYGTGASLIESFSKENLSGNVNAWDNAANQLRSMFPWATDDELANALHARRPQTATEDIGEPLDTTKSSGGLNLFGRDTTPAERIQADIEFQQLLSNIEGGTSLVPPVVGQDSTSGVTQEWEVDEEGNLVIKKK